MRFVSENDFIRLLTQKGLLNKQILSALELAKNAHHQQKRDNGKDYLQWHIYPVTYAIVQNYLDSCDLQKLVAVALLHDVLENLPGERKHIEAITDIDIADIVFCITKPENPLHDSYSQQEKYEENRRYTDIVKTGSIIGIIVKLEDRLQNLESTTAEILSVKLEKYKRYVRECCDFYIPMAEKVNNGIDYKSLLEKEVRRLSSLLGI